MGMRMSKKELKDFLDQYGNTDMGKAVKAQLDEVPTVEKVENTKPERVVRTGLNTKPYIWKYIWVTVGLVVILVNPVIGVLVLTLTVIIARRKAKS